MFLSPTTTAAITAWPHNKRGLYLLMKLSGFLPDCIALFVICLGIVRSEERASAQTRPMGTDVSSYQGGSLNWTTIKNDGISFAWTKATEGTYYQDADFAINEAHAKAAGIPIGAYHFARPSDNPNITGTTSADTEAAYFWSFAGSYVVAGGGYLVPMLDWEDVYVTNAGLNFTATKLSQWANEWCNAVSNYAYAKGLVIKPVIYTGSWFSKPGTYPGLNTTVTNWPSWISDYPYCTGNQCGSPCPQTCTPTAAATFPWNSWNIWQYGDTNWSGGDSDVFNGTTNQFLQLFVVGGSGPVAPAGSTMYWDAGAKKASPGSGGSGSWDTSTADWWLSGTSNWVWSPNGDNPIFAGSNGTVTLNAAVKAGKLTFNTAGYTITGTGNTLTLTNNPSLISVPPPGTTPTYINCILSGSGYTVTGGGVLVLNNAANSSVSPITLVSNTTLVIASSHALGTGSGTVTISNGACLQNNDTTSGDAFLSSTFNIVIGTGGGSLNDNLNASLSYGGVISGSGNLTKIGGGGGTGGTLILNGTNTYTGNTIISQGFLTLGSTGSINNSPGIIIAAGASFDVSALANWTLGSGAVLQASGTGTTVAISAAALKGAATGSVSLGSQPITLTYTPATTSGDATHPALYVSQGTLTLNGNVFSISNASGKTLAGGAYTVVRQASGSISGAPNPTPLLSGMGLVSGAQFALLVSNTSVILSVTNPTATTLNALTPSPYGQPVMFTATVTPSPTGGTVQFYDNGVTLGSAVTVSGGTSSYSANGLSAGNHPITAAYSGAGFYAASSTAGASPQQVNAPPAVTGISVLSDGSLQLNFSGTAGSVYLIEAATNLTPPIVWTTLSTNTADTNGLFSFIDLTATNYNGRYYRTAVSQ
jgi:autotransporter-associated beta strand protein